MHADRWHILGAGAIGSLCTAALLDAGQAATLLLRDETALARWQAESVGRHWGHVDRRRIGFRALLDLSDASGSWKLRALTVLEARALDG